MDITTAQDDQTQPDCGRIEADQCLYRKFPPVVGTRDATFTVLSRQSALNAVYRHGYDHHEIEVCGVLLGNACHDGQRPFLFIESIVAGAHAEGHVAQVTFTSDTWTHFHDVIDREHPDKRIIGWYHTHPGFGIFLSGMDMFIHRNFFNLPWQVAMVYDPIRAEEGIFVWQGGKAVRAKYLIHDDVFRVKPPPLSDDLRPPPDDEVDPDAPAPPTRPLLKRVKDWLRPGQA